MTPAVVVGLALGAAGLHAAWNVLLKTSGDPLSTATRSLVIAAAVITPAALVVWWRAGWPSFPTWAWFVLLASTVSEVVYFELLSRAYIAGELSLVYPIARGTGPVVAVVGGLLLLHEHLSGSELIGVLALVGGMWLARGRDVRLGGLGFALGAGAAIGIYTLLDGTAVKAVNPLQYGWLLWLGLAVGLALRTRLGPLHGPEIDWRASAGIGLMMTAAYFLILFALSLAPVSLVAPLRESAVVLVAAWGVWRLKESGHVVLRLTGAAAILGGIALIASS